MTAANLDLDIEQGATFTRVFSFFDSSGAPIDVSLWTFRGQIRAYESAATVLASFAFVNGPLAYQTTCTISDTDTSAIPVIQTGVDPNRVVRVCIYDIETEKPDTTVDRIFQGYANVSGEVTR